MAAFETIYAFIIGICESCAYWYVRLFPPLGFASAVFFLIAAENAVKQSRGALTASDGMFILAIIIIFVLMSALWVILHLMEKLSNSRPPRHYRRSHNK